MYVYRPMHIPATQSRAQTYAFAVFAAIRNRA